MDEMYECLYNLINYGYLFTDTDIEMEYDNYDDYDNEYHDDYGNYDEEDYDNELDYVSQDSFKLLESEVEYYVDGEKVSKDAYDDAWDDRLGYLGSSNWEELGLSIVNANTDEIIFSGKIS